MKNIVMILVSAVLGVLTLMIVMTVDGRSNRSMELESSLSSVVEETVEIMTVDQKYNISDTNTFLADFVENLSGILDSDSGITVKILSADKEKGLLAIRVTEEFTHPNGRRGTVECERKVILNKPEETDPEMYTVRFYATAEAIYKSCSVYEGDTIMAPANPVSESGTFAGWTDANGYLADFTQPVTQDMAYYAMWN